MAAKPSATACSSSLLAFPKSDADFPVGHDPERALKLVGIVGDELIDQSKIDQEEVGPVIHDQPGACGNIRKSDDLDRLLSILDTLVRELTELCFLHGAEACGGAHAANVLKAHDVLRIALLHHAACRGAQIDNEVYLLRALRGIIKGIPHCIRLAVRHRGNLTRPSAKLEFDRHTDAFERGLGQFRVKSDQVIEVLGSRIA